MNWIFRILHADHRIGLRIIKTGVAVTVCVVISFFARLDQPFIAVIATVMSMGKSIDVSVKSGKDKMVGVLIGTAVGIPFAMLSPANAGLCGIGVMVVLYLCHFFRLNSAGALACVVFSAVMFGASVPVWHGALVYAGDALIGIAVAIVVNLIIMPPNYAEGIKRAYGMLREQTLAALEDAEAKREIDIRSIDATIEQFNRFLKLYISESRFLRWNDDEVFDITCKVAVYRRIFDELKVIEMMDLPEKDHPDSELLTVYHYHIARIHQLYGSTLRAQKEELKKE